MKFRSYAEPLQSKATILAVLFLFPVLFSISVVPSASAQTIKAPGQGDARSERMGALYPGSCASQGSWTQAALTQTQEIEKVIFALKDDENCKGIETIVQDIQISQTIGTGAAADQQKASRLETLPNEIAALRSLMISEASLRSKVSQLIFNKTLEGMNIVSDLKGSGNFTSVNQRINQVSDSSLTFLNQAMTRLPSYAQCLQSHPNQAIALLGATARLAAAFAVGGEGVTSRLGNTIANFASFMREMKFNKMLQKTNENQYWSSLSCLIEATSEAYCSAKDAYEFLDYQHKEEAIQAEIVNKMGRSGNPLEGYYLIVRELPIIAEWLQKVQFGVQPKLTVDAQFRISTIQTIAELQKDAYLLNGLFNEEIVLYSTLTDTRAKKNFLFILLQKLLGVVHNRSGQANFFDMTVNTGLMPFYLIGMNEQPPETYKSTGKSMAIMSWEMWMQDGGNYAPPYQEPDKLVMVMRQRIATLVEGAMAKGSAYFQQRMILDTPNLVNESLTSQTLTVHQSLKNVDNYLAGLVKRFTNITPDVTIVPTLVDTRYRLSKIINSYAAVNEVQKWYQQKLLEMNGRPTQEVMEDFQKRTLEAYMKVVEAVYNEFNVLLQRDTFLSTRLTTIVNYDFADRVRRKDNMTEYQKELLIVTGKNLLEQLQQVNKVNPQATEMDLNQAQVLNVRNLEVVEDLMSDSLMEIVSAINTRIGGKAVKSGWRNLSFTGLAKNFFFFPPQTDYIKNLWERLYFVPTFPSRDRDDEYGSFIQTRAKLCVQSLAFFGAWKFDPLCKGTVLESRYAPNVKDVRLDVSYDQLLKLRYSNVLKRKGDPAGRSTGICALRAYLRKNHAYWLTKGFSLETTGTLPLATPADPKSVVTVPTNPSGKTDLRDHINR